MTRTVPLSTACCISASAAREDSCVLARLTSKVTNRRVVSEMSEATASETGRTFAEMLHDSVRKSGD